MTMSHCLIVYEASSSSCYLGLYPINPLLQNKTLSPNVIVSVDLLVYHVDDMRMTRDYFDDHDDHENGEDHP